MKILIFKALKMPYLSAFLRFLKFVVLGRETKTQIIITQITCVVKQKINYKGMKTNLIRITKEESIEARKRFPNVHIAITSRGKTHNRKRYYLEENRAAMG